MFITVIGIVLVATGSKSVAVVGGILVLALCATALAGYGLGTLFVTRGATLAAVQNEFMSAMSHEIRTPLTSIRMFIETLRDDRVTDPAERHRCLAIVHQELGRLDGLVGKLSTLSKIESRHTAFDRRPVAVSDIVNDARAALDAVRLGAEGDLRVSLQPDLSCGAIARRSCRRWPVCWSTPGSTPRPTANASTSRATGDAAHVTIEVSDNGPGVTPEEQRDDLREVPARLRRRGQRQRRHGAGPRGRAGDRQRAPRPGRRPRQCATRRPVSHRAAPRARGGGVTTADAAPAGTLVTIVEDDPAIAEGLALNLRLQGHRTETVGDAETALARISEAAPALVLLDITLPKQSGLWVLERLRGPNNHVPVIVLSARQDEFDKVAALRLGADDYVTKPFALAELLARVAACCDARVSAAVRRPPRRRRRRRRSPTPRRRTTRRWSGSATSSSIRRRRTVSRAGAPVALTHREFELLAFLCGSGGRVLLARRAPAESVGSRARRAGADRRQLRRPAAREARGGSRPPEASAHRTRQRLPLRSLNGTAPSISSGPSH